MFLQNLKPTKASVLVENWAPKDLESWQQPFLYVPKFISRNHLEILNMSKINQNSTWNYGGWLRNPINHQKDGWNPNKIMINHEKSWDVYHHLPPFSTGDNRISLAHQIPWTLVWAPTRRSEEVDPFALKSHHFFFRTSFFGWMGFANWGWVLFLLFFIRPFLTFINLVLSVLRWKPPCFMATKKMCSESFSSRFSLKLLQWIFQSNSKANNRWIIHLYIIYILLNKKQFKQRLVR